jgi:sugar lactone lactonase YvrE
VWVARETALYWLDIKGRKIFRLDEHEHVTEWPTPMRIGSIAPRRSGGFIAGTDEGIAIVDRRGIVRNRRQPGRAAAG